eukprot:TRINITY_DN7241_c0_g1_i1.p1 TRINITY_DN7241_c0_g1~~TRINITY_DN7241_c0_g1_i1.p1  ORF type:complete len:405 (-),score=95.74 TRINITY_DN7241_c0_g1_i1:35-1183(-)
MSDAGEQQLSFQGWLHKRGEQGLKLWKKRWFALRNQKIYYFKKATDNSQHLGSISISDVVFIGPSKDLNKPGSTAYFEIQTKSGRTYHLWSEVASESQQWLDVLSQAKKHHDDKVNEQKRLEQERQQALRQEQLAREEALRRPASTLPPTTASFGELLGHVEAAKTTKPLNRLAVTASTPDYRKQEESLFDLQKEIETVAKEAQKKEQELPAPIAPPEPEKVSKLIITGAPSATSTTGVSPNLNNNANLPMLSNTSTSSSSSGSIPPMITRAPSSNPHIPMMAPPIVTTTSNSALASENDREEFIPNLANLPSLKLGTPSNDGHLPVGGRRSHELHEVGGGWKSSINGDTRGSHGEAWDEDDETSPDNDCLNRCCHITCYIL